ncbi:uncharacterized protein MYCFIDRAFT_179410 [Pseudocercospora fijiensis CIRAD86]|uniref:Uncharacterized protein n=1 Tax=Pseudocercospora fijiensis (strain CIRAD86) TaxID=383855 RepID=M2YJM6_PSEFD|nr:uncharacterized protein MYCFIDRAFT_179410 [Pseudocercospora fijiensis CIRAD86]EME77955.1 hypothetical protein MYCFIDRAFT_179410 [Pseudocercospora fijiensis CIRAD86]
MPWPLAWLTTDEASSIGSRKVKDDPGPRPKIPIVYHHGEWSKGSDHLARLGLIDAAATSRLEEVFSDVWAGTEPALSDTLVRDTAKACLADFKRLRDTITRMRLYRPCEESRTGAPLRWMDGRKGKSNQRVPEPRHVRTLCIKGEVFFGAKHASKNVSTLVIKLLRDTCKDGRPVHEGREACRSHPIINRAV